MILSMQLEKGGYDKKLIDKTFTMVLKLDRDDLIEYKIKNSLKFED